MSPRRTRRGTIRDNVGETCIYNDLKSTTKILRSTRRTNKSQAIKSSEEESDNTLEVNSSLGNGSFINATPTRTRKSKRKAQEISINHSLLSLTTDDSKIKTSTKKTKSINVQSKRKVKSNKSEIVDTSFAGGNVSFEAKSQKEKKQVSYSINNLISDDEENIYASSNKKLRSGSSSSRYNKQIRTSERAQKTSNNNLKTPEKETTPKSSPLNISLTPHRSTKTPKKSPINLGSPKTHARDSFKLLNVQRKLSIIDCPSSENSNDSVQQLNFSNYGNSSSDNKNKDESSISVLKHSLSKKKSISPLKVRQRFSKSPKIFLRTPKSKSTKSMKTSSTKRTPIKKSSKTNKSSKSEKTPAISSTKSKRTQKINLENVAKLLEQSKDLTEFEKSKELSENEKSIKSEFELKTENSPESNSPIKNKKSGNSSTKLTKSQKKNVHKKSLNSPTSNSQKSKKSPKTISPLNSKKMPKIILSSKKSKTGSSAKKSNKSATLSKKSSKSLSPSKKSSKSPKSVDALETDDLSINSSNKQHNDSKFPSLSPQVLINKISSTELKISDLSTKKNQPVINLVPVDHMIKKFVKSDHKKVLDYDYKSPKSPINKVPSEVDSSIYTNLQTEGSAKKVKEKIKTTLNFKNNKKISKRSRSSIILNGSSTPKPESIERLYNKSTVKIHQPLLEDESEPSLNESSLINMSNVFELDNLQRDNTFELNESNLDKRKSLQELNTFEKNNKNNTFEIDKYALNASEVKSVKDNTYELETSKNGSLIKSNKKSLNGMELSANQELESKKSCRVHFANNSLVSASPANAINRVGTPGHAIHQKKTSISNKTPTNQSLLNKIQNKRRISSASKLQMKTPISTPINRRLSNSLADTTLKSRKSIHEAQIASVNRLSRPKPIVNSERKLGTRTPVTSKIPNFADIHKKNFEKMESLVDLKKRIEKRHLTLNNPVSSAKKKGAIKGQNGINKAAPLDSTNGVYNKYGFKLRKNDAVSMVSNKQAVVVASREKKREDARNILKGVRMNRRFELQMKSRIKNS